MILSCNWHTASGFTTREAAGQFGPSYPDLRGWASSSVIRLFRSISSATYFLKPNSYLYLGTFNLERGQVAQVADELQHRPDLAHLPGGDYQHLAVDAGRAYSALTAEWLKYMAHLLQRYPYLFSLALRTNLFDPTASPVITDVG